MAGITHFFRDWNNRKQTALTMTAGFLILVAVFWGNLRISPDDITMNIAIAGQGPSAAHIFGVDWIGRDMFLRTVKGLGGSLRVGVIATTVAIVVAIGLAVMSAVLWRGVDQMVGLFIDTFLGIPHLVLMVLISASLGGGETGVIVAVAATHWPSLTRVLRAEIMQLREEPFIQIARNFGRSKLFIAGGHMLLHLLPQILVRFVLLFPHVILHESAITFLGFGLSPLQPAIGVILSESVQHIATGMWWLVLFPGASLLILVMGFEAVGEGLHKLLNPDTART